MKILEPEVITKIRYTAGMRCWQEKGLKKKKNHWGWGDSRNLKLVNVLSWYIKFPEALGTMPRVEEGELSSVSVTQQGVL